MGVRILPIGPKYIKIMDFLQFLKRAVPCSGVECTMIFFLENVEKSYYLDTVMLTLYQKLLIGSYIAAWYGSFHQKRQFCVFPS